MMKIIAFTKEDGFADFAAATEAQFDEIYPTLSSPKLVITEAEFMALPGYRNCYKIVDGALVEDQSSSDARTQDQIKKQAKHLLIQSDWAALPDTNLANQTEWDAYRAALREIFISGVLPESGYPTEPQAIWA